MSVYQKNKKITPDSEFLPGSLEFIVPNNYSRLLDPRRTPGMIENYFPESGIFRWKILAFEDKGNHWDLPAEMVTRFQFDKGSKKLSKKSTDKIQKTIDRFSHFMRIDVSEDKKTKLEKELSRLTIDIKIWLKKYSGFFSSGEKLNFKSDVGSRSLQKDLLNYMKSVELLEQEIKTTDILYLNPGSGEWIKGMRIVMAEIGLQSYKDKVPRTKDIFSGQGNKSVRKKYLLHRIAFVRAYFELLNIKNVTVYRGMRSESGWTSPMYDKSFSSWSFNIKVAKANAGFSKKFADSYLVKRTFPINKIFMTYFETTVMSKRYKEAEALILHDENDIIRLDLLRKSF